MSARDWIIIFSVITTGAAVFIADLLLPTGYVINLFYVIPLLLSFLLPQRGSVYLAMSCITALVFARVFAAQPVTDDPAVIPLYLSVFNRTVAVACGWIVAYIMERHKFAIKQLSESEGELQMILNAGPTLIAHIDAGFQYVRVNNIYKQWFGLAPQQVVGRHIREILGDAGWQKVRPYVERVMAGEKAEYELELPMPEGKSRWLRATYTPDRDDSGRVRGVVVHAIDIGERKKAEENLLREKRFSEFIVDSMPGVFCLLDQDLKLLRWNDNLEEVSGYSPEDLSALRLPDLFGLGEMEADAIRRAFAVGKISIEANLLSKGGQVTPYHFGATLMSIDDTPYLIGVGIDIAERKRTREALRSSEAQLRALFDQSPVSIQIFSPDGWTLKVNRGWEELWGYESDEQKEYLKYLRTYNVLQNRQLVAKGLMPFIQKGFAGEAVETPVILYDPAELGFPGRHRWAKAFIYPIRDEAGRIFQVALMHVDLTERVETEKALEDSRQQLQAVMDNSLAVIVMKDPEGRYLLINRRYEDLFHVTKEWIIGKTDTDLFPAETADILRVNDTKVLTTRTPQASEELIPQDDGIHTYLSVKYPLLDAGGVPYAIGSISTDITERKQAEAQLQHITFHDKVTGLYNRTYFEQEVRRIDTERDLPISIIMGDVNHLKLTNDVFGHGEGDKLLKTVAKAIKKGCREHDITARWGGDEFVVILPATGVNVSDEITNRIKQRVQECKGTIIPCSLALGAATKEKKHQNIYQIMRQAEEKMYDDKLAGIRLNEADVLSALLGRVREKRKDLFDHIARSLALADPFSKELGLTENQREDLQGLIKFHDIGWVAMPREIATKPERLTEEEWDVVKREPEAGFRIVKSFAGTARIADEVLSRTERWDGMGYPRGLRSEEIPYLARVLSVIDAYDVMTHDRPYARALNPEEAVEELRRNAGRQFDPALVEVFVNRCLLEA